MVLTVCLNLRPTLGTAIATNHSNCYENPDKHPEPQGKNAQNEMQKMVWGITNRHCVFLAMRTETAALLLTHEISPFGEVKIPNVQAQGREASLPAERPSGVEC